MMLTHLFAVLAATRIIAAQNADLYNNFGSVVFIRSGERTPASILNPGTQTLTPLGAQQMYTLGSQFRGRYITTTGAPRGLGTQVIANMSPDILNASQLSIQTLDKPYLVSSAQAFMQGLYPASKMNSNGSGVSSGVTYGLANGSQVDFPLGGYQYANVLALGDMDPQSVYLDGMTNCPEAARDSLMYEVTEEYLEARESAKALYNELDPGWLGSEVTKAEIDYRYAIDIYDHLSYAYTHNRTVYSALQNSTQNIYNRTRFLADQSAYYHYANSTLPTSTKLANQAMAGRTLAALILGQLQKIIEKAHNASSTAPTAPPLTLLFGDFEPLTSFFNIAVVHQLHAYFKSMPPYASAMALELYSLRKNTTFPDSADDLYVSFYFHNGTDDFDGQISTYSLFGNGNSQGMMKWADFQDMMGRIMMNKASDWCTACNSPALFCSGFDGDGGSIYVVGSGGGGRGGARAKYNVTPAVAGVIGAVVALVVAGVLFAAAMLIGGVRVRRESGAASRGIAGLGGFKGSAKLASDPDVSLAKNGGAPAGTGAGFASWGDKDRGRVVAHERVGSWELGAKERAGATERDLRDRTDGSPRESFEAIEAAMSRPVRAAERV